MAYSINGRASCYSFGWVFLLSSSSVFPIFPLFFCYYRCSTRFLLSWRFCFAAAGVVRLRCGYGWMMTRGRSVDARHCEGTSIPEICVNESCIRDGTSISFPCCPISLFVELSLFAFVLFSLLCLLAFIFVRRLCYWLFVHAPEQRLRARPRA